MPSQLDQIASTFEPLVKELSPAPQPIDVFRRFSRLPNCLYLDSANRQPELGRYSYVAAEPIGWLRVPADGSDALTQLQSSVQRIQSTILTDLPPFQGGIAGLIAYDLGRSLERLPQPRVDEFHGPALAMGIYDVVFAFDHLQQRAWLVSQGWPESDAQRRRERARSRLDHFHDVVHQSAWATEKPTPAKPIDVQSMSPHFEISSRKGLLSNFSAGGYEQAVRQSIEYIHAGEVFQVNLAQRLLFPAKCDSIQLYERLRLCNPAPFAAYFDLGDFQIASASPERFLQVHDGWVEARPIKGTRPRFGRSEAELYSSDELRQSDKDRAENVMIVDLMRNDLSRVCTPESVHVSQLCGVENYEYVQHLVSAVTGQLSPNHTVIDVLRATFPGGSITGAPKVRAMEIIAELEPHARGAYCGCLGYLSGNQEMDFSILIRTITAGGGWWQLPVGGGIVSQSHPRQEYAETWHKAEGLLRAIESVPT